MKLSFILYFILILFNSCAKKKRNIIIKETDQELEMIEAYKEGI